MVFNPFKNDAFSLVNMTEAINVFPNQYGKIGQMGLFRERGVTTQFVLIERRNGVLNLLPSTEVGAPPTVGRVGKRDIIPLTIPHIPHADVVLPSEVQGIRQFGTENTMSTVTDKVSEKLETMSRKHDITLEYLRMGALKGQVLDADGTTVLCDLYTEFGISQQVQHMALDSNSTEVATKTLDITRYIEDNLRGETSTGTIVLCSAAFWDAFTTHDAVKFAYQFWLNQPNVLRDDVRNGFKFQDVTFVEYRGKASRPDGTVVPFIADGEAHAFPLGTSDTFHTYFAPANFNETVNTVGIAKYAKQEERPMGRGWDLYTESNPLPVCLRPDLLVKLTVAGS